MSLTFSIITVCYNSSATIADTLESVARQQHPGIEHLIIDGVSQDNTLAIARQYPHVSKIISEPDSGLYDAMNKGIAHATGQYIAFLNADDFYATPGTLQRVARQLKDTQADTLYGDLHYVTAQPPFNVVRHWKSGPYRHRNFLHGWMPPHPTFFARRALFEQYGSFDLRFRSAADYELMLRFLYKHKASATYLPEVLVKMRTGGMSNASFRHRIRANREDHLAWQVNGLKPYPHTTILKPLRKLGQWFRN
ncbi:MAG: glycosyltransferase [bacterium]|uniref:Family 2 glycosyl transferase n=2 Tax=Phaeodactylibacter TaxID=1564515 RepID=A0A098S2K7_9BACT|nr:family 2 glycosyl transferase [Phaeodactylibacter xiamenensis]MCR9054004.1 glycosyltransferase [bacterium]TXB63817.1 glycosyltransferase [Phaeodactylibacter luteus]